MDEGCSTDGRRARRCSRSGPRKENAPQSGASLSNLSIVPWPHRPSGHDLRCLALLSTSRRPDSSGRPQRQLTPPRLRSSPRRLRAARGTGSPCRNPCRASPCRSRRPCRRRSAAACDVVVTVRSFVPSAPEPSRTCNQSLFMMPALVFTTLPRTLTFWFASADFSVKTSSTFLPPSAFTMPVRSTSSVGRAGGWSAGMAAGPAGAAAVGAAAGLAASCGLPLQPETDTAAVRASTLAMVAFNTGILRLR